MTISGDSSSDRPKNSAADEAVTKSCLNNARLSDGQGKIAPACLNSCGICERFYGRLNRLFGASDIRLSVGFWLGLLLPLILSLQWLPGEMRFVQNSSGNYVSQLHIGFLTAMTGPLLLVLLALVMSVYAGTINLGVWGIAAASCVGFRYLYNRIDSGERCVIIVLFVAAVLALLVYRLHLRCCLKGIFLSLLIGLGGNFWAVNTRVSLPISTTWLASPGFSISVCGLCLVFLWFILGFNWSFSSPAAGKLLSSEKLGFNKKYRLVLFVASYVLAALGGVLAAFSSNSVGTGGYLGDMRVLAAASLCILPLNRGRSAVLFSCMLAPISLLTVNMWLECVVAVFGGVDGTSSMLIMAALVLGVRLIALGRGGRIIRRIAAFLAGLGVLTVALSSYWPFEIAARYYLAAGVLLWLIGFAVGLPRVVRILSSSDGELTVR